MYIPPEVFAEGGVAVLTLCNSFIKISERLNEEAKKNGRMTSLADVVADLRADAFVVSGQFVNQIQAWKIEMQNQEIDVSKKFGEIEETGWFWKNRHDKVLAGFQPYLTAIQTRLCSFIDDAIAIARCAGIEEALIISQQDAKALKGQIRQDTNLNTHSIEEVIKAITDYAEQLRADLAPVAA